MAGARATGRDGDDDLVHALRAAGIADVDGSALAQALYSCDASLYRVPPRVVVRPRHTDEVLATLDVCRTLGVPLTMRGAGTSIAGNAVGPGVVVDTSRFLDRVLSLDPQARTAQVEPGVVLSALQAAASPHGLRFGPDPSTHNRCTLGGMIGNDACGSRALAYGRTSANVVALDVVTGGGVRTTLTTGVGSAPGAGSGGATTAASGGGADLVDAVRGLVADHLAVVRTEFGRFGRQVSGYALENLLPERGTDLGRTLVGSEGTLAVVLGATVRLVPEPPFRALAVLGYPTMADAADAVPGVLPFAPTACEGLDVRIVDRVRQVPGAVVPDLPAGGGWLVVELPGGTAAEAEAAARRVVALCGTADAGAVGAHVATGAEAAAIWRIREDGAGLAGRTPQGRPAHAGWEDAAVPPARLGGYLRDFDALLDAHGLHGVPYGHFGDGCLHVRIDLPFDREPEAVARQRFRDFLGDAARLVVAAGGSLSGEHGDGRARSELLPVMYSPAAIALFSRVKDLLDPDDVLNPGVLVRPAPADADLRAVGARPVRERLALAYPHDGGDFSAAVHRCTGVGKCRADLTATGGVMCPSYRATRDEKDSTRGRARVLEELIGRPRPSGTGAGPDWGSPEVHAALDLCLACKGCASDCPAGVDMATYKAEVLHQTYRGRLRPLSHYVLGRLPMWSDLAARMPRLANAVTGSRAGGALARRVAGVDPRRSLPRFATQTFGAWWLHRPVDAAAGGAGAVAPHGRVALWVDSFTDHFAPDVAVAAVGVLEAAGYAVEVPQGLCCGLTWLTTGQLDAGRERVRHTVRGLEPLVRHGVPVVGVEPSCTAVLRGDARHLLPDEPGVEVVAAGVRTLAELLAATPGWVPPDLTGVEVVAQPHCHHHAVMGWTADEALLRGAGARVTRVGGCCGLAGNWGVERGHHDVSVAVARTALLPAVEAAPDAVLLADGFSCRTQLDQLAGRRAVHLAGLLADHLPE
ncbi:FAD-binding and (Fe-S)-binding domain-containing protein [Kineosporia sp. A_224]|uniref:FAD-binding and (Fe-S)-binding domain-containing protein n=1 Tax=Kineosporia sp. A_224 TaxID=1962180 RepID=UPI000B4B3981|nr:FAD-binding and (Fe-S)-binding domain-containing protein [Kineosporia sp. A_224]